MKIQFGKPVDIESLDENYDGPSDFRISGSTAVRYLETLVKASKKSKGIIFTIKGRLKMNIIVDTNILRTDFLFRSECYKLFAEFIRKTQSTLVLSKVVFEEASYLYKQELEIKKKDFRKALSNILYFEKGYYDCSVMKIIENTNSEYEKHLYDIFLNHWEIIDYKNILINELVRRSIHRIKPCSNKGEEFRDTIVWLSIIDFLKKNRNEKNIFISNDRKAFANENGRDLHLTLVNEISKDGLELCFCNSLEQFIKEFTSEISFCTRDWVIDHIDWNEINKQVNKAVETIHCGYFFTLYERTINEPWDYYYDVRNVEINKEQLEYHVCEKENGKFIIELLFSGLVTIDFFLVNDEVQPITTKFFTQTTGICTKNEILEYSGNYYEEESALMLPDKQL